MRELATAWQAKALSRRSTFCGVEPLALKLLLCGVMAASLVAAVTAPAPAARTETLLLRLATIPVAFHTIALLALLGDRPRLAAAALVGGVEAACYLMWLSRGHDDGGGGGDEGPSPLDWDAFDRARAGWGRRPRVPV
jgi:hypothetical protein